MRDAVYILKATGEREAFDSQKLFDSLTRSSASGPVAEKIVSHIESELKDGMSTKEIYKHAFELLDREEKPAAARYSLRRAIMDMGPTGFPFEQLVAEIFRARGFETTTEFIARGECAEHEIDITAWNENKLVFVEAKFHNELGLKSDLKVVLYIKARWDDLLSMKFEGFGENKRSFDEGWLVTNTKFSQAAIDYALCRKMRLIGWNYPSKDNLQDLIIDAGLHPITCLNSLSHKEKQTLMGLGLILCKQAKENQDIVAQAVSQNKIIRMLDEINLMQK
jgi:hypothetical protein